MSAVSVIETLPQPSRLEPGPGDALIVAPRYSRRSRFSELPRAKQLQTLPRYLLELDGNPPHSPSATYPVIRSAAIEALAASAG